MQRERKRKEKAAGKMARRQNGKREENAQSANESSESDETKNVENSQAGSGEPPVTDDSQSEDQS